MKIKIVSDGGILGTGLVNAETGEPIEGVSAIEWRIDARTGSAEATITINDVLAEVIAKSVQIKNKNAVDGEASQ